MNQYELIITIVNKGFTSVVMDAARKVGARGGTILNAKGSGNHEAEKMFGLVIRPEKELVLILASREDRNPIMQAIIKDAGLNSLGMGICFSMPVDEVMGVALGINQAEATTDNAPQEAPETAPEGTESQN